MLQKNKKYKRNKANRRWIFKPKKSTDRSICTEKVSKQNELVSDFGYELINISKMVIPSFSIEQIDNMFKEQFFSGIFSESLREKVKMKSNKVVEILRNKISIEELIK